MNDDELRQLAEKIVYEHLDKVGRFDSLRK